MVGTPVYNTKLMVVRSIPSSAGVLPSHTPPAHPAVKWVPSLYKARVDKATDCGNQTSGGPDGTSSAHTTITGATVSAPASTWPGFRS